MSVQAKLTEVVSISSWIPSSGTVTFVGAAIAIGPGSPPGRCTQRAAGSVDCASASDLGPRCARRRAAARRVTRGAAQKEVTQSVRQRRISDDIALPAIRRSGAEVHAWQVCHTYARVAPSVHVFPIIAKHTKHRFQGG